MHITKLYAFSVARAFAFALRVVKTGTFSRSYISLWVCVRVFRWNVSRCVALGCILLCCVGMHSVVLRRDVFRCVALGCISLCCVGMYSVVLRWVVFRCVATGNFLGAFRGPKIPFAQTMVRAQCQEKIAGTFLIFKRIFFPLTSSNFCLLFRVVWRNGKFLFRKTSHRPRHDYSFVFCFSVSVLCFCVCGNWGHAVVSILRLHSGLPRNNPVHKV